MFEISKTHVCVYVFVYFFDQKCDEPFFYKYFNFYRKSFSFFIRMNDIKHHTYHATNVINPHSIITQKRVKISRTLQKLFVFVLMTMSVPILMKFLPVSSSRHIFDFPFDVLFILKINNFSLIIGSR